MSKYKIFLSVFLIVFIIMIQVLLGSHWISTLCIVALVLVYLLAEHKLTLQKKEQKQQKEEEVAFANWQSFMNESQVVSDRVVAVVTEMNQAIEKLTEIADFSSQQEKVLKGISQQSLEQVEKTLQALNNLQLGAEQINDFSSSMNVQSEKTKSGIDEICSKVNETKKVMDQVLNYNTLTIHSIQKLTSHASHIDEINNFIKDVVSQTQLLSLNASIEAARAGEAGRGFSVVAQEIKKLAEQSHEAVGRSSKIVSAIETSVHEVMEAIEEEKEAVNKSVADMNHMNKLLNNINKEMNDLNNWIEKNNAAGEEQRDLTNNGLEKLHQIKNYTEDTLHTVEKTVSQMERQRSQINTLQKISMDLEASSQELAAAIQSINIKSDDKEETINTENIDMDEWKTKIRMIVQNKAIQTLDENIHAKWLTQYKEEDPQIEAIWSNRLDGSFIYSNPPAGLLNAQKRDWFQKALENDFFVSNVYISAITKKPCLTLSTAIVNENGEKCGVLGMDIKWQ